MGTENKSKPRRGAATRRPAAGGRWERGRDGPAVGACRPRPSPTMHGARRAHEIRRAESRGNDQSPRTVEGAAAPADHVTVVGVGDEPVSALGSRAAVDGGALDPQKGPPPLSRYQQCTMRSGNLVWVIVCASNPSPPGLTPPISGSVRAPRSFCPNAKCTYTQLRGVFWL